MAEILLSLTIIGVVAAITLPSLTGNINERTWNTQRKALYARMSQAFALMPALNGYGTLTEDASGSVTEDTVAETFITAGLSKVLKINNICNNTNYSDCGFPTKFTTMLNPTVKNTSEILTMSGLNPILTSASYPEHDTTSGAPYIATDTKAAAFETGNGESILLHYNPHCVANMNETGHYWAQPKICVNMIYDLNGSKGPNTVGKDMGFLTVLYPTDSSVVAPMPYNKVIGTFTSVQAPRACTNEVGDEYRLPTKDELASLFVNKNILNTPVSANHWYSSSKISATVNWVMVASLGEYRTPRAGAGWYSFCVKR